VITPGIVDVRTSAIHGKGLFAARRIRKGEHIGQIVGRLTTEDGPHVLWLTDELGIEVLNDLRYINHSDSPNAAYFDDGEVAALRNIQPGEEITHHYGEPDFDDIAELIDDDPPTALTAQTDPAADPVSDPKPVPATIQAFPTDLAPPASPTRIP